MGALGGTLMYYAEQHIQENLQRYMPEKES